MSRQNAVITWLHTDLDVEAGAVAEELWHQREVSADDTQRQIKPLRFLMKQKKHILTTAIIYFTQRSQKQLWFHLRKRSEAWIVQRTNTTCIMCTKILFFSIISKPIALIVMLSCMSALKSGVLFGQTKFCQQRTSQLFFWPISSITNYQDGLMYFQF